MMTVPLALLKLPTLFIMDTFWFPNQAAAQKKLFVETFYSYIYSELITPLSRVYQLLP